MITRSLWKRLEEDKTPDQGEEYFVQSVRQLARSSGEPRGRGRGERKKKSLVY